MKTQLVALKGKLYSKSFQLGEGERLIIGRGQDADIQILDSGLSRQHCYLERSGGAFYIADMNSRNGTWVNGEQVTRQKLMPGDHIRFGGVEFEFRCEPERRRMAANLIAAFPELPGREVREKVEIDGSDLMALPAPFQSIENYQRIQRDLATIYRVGNLISGETDIQRLYERVLDAITEVVNADRIFVLTPGEDGELAVVAQRMRANGEATAAGASFSRTIAQECFAETVCILRANALVDERYGQAESVLAQNIHSVVCVPVPSPDKCLGVIYADTIAQSEAFARHDLELLTAVAKQAGVAFQRAKLSEQVRSILYGTVRALVAAIEAKDEYTRGHSERVTAYALSLGRTLGLGAAALNILELGGLLHDVGKIGVPENILRKAGPLTEEEYEIVKAHPRLGWTILGNIEGAGEIAEVILHHHERWDGRGYPDRLAGDAPSVQARILAVADAFDAMSSQRPYRDRLAQAKVLEQIQRGAGAQFDPRIAQALVAEATAGRIAIRASANAPCERRPEMCLAGK